MMITHKISTMVLIILILIGTAGAVIVNIDGSNFVPLSWFNANKTVWDGLPTNNTVNFHTGNASNITTGTLPNAVMPANVSYNNTGTLISVYNSSNSIALINAADTLVKLDTEVIDSNSEFSANTFTAKTTGLYNVNGNVLFSSPVVLKVYCSELFINGVMVVESCAHSSTTTGVSAPFSKLVQLNVSDTLNLYAVSYSGDNNIVLYGDPRYAYLTIARVMP